MRYALIIALAAMPLATTAQAGGITGFDMPHLTWPQEDAAPETPTRDCAVSPTVLSEQEVSVCQPEG